uniref:Uncharacterized protein n=1 Tax=mine drainage metagenome TaxID=410659 RepID=E6PQI3_9ZZZZ
MAAPVSQACLIAAQIQNPEGSRVILLHDHGKLPDVLKTHLVAHKLNTIHRASETRTPSP